MGIRGFHDQQARPADLGARRIAILDVDIRCGQGLADKRQIPHPVASKRLTVALGVYPHEEPGVGPNKYNFNDDVLYEIHVALGNDVKAGEATLSYQFQFKTGYRNRNTILQSYLGVVNNVADAAQNLVQTYTVTKVDRRRGGRTTLLGNGVVPPNNQGNATPFYNQGNNGVLVMGLYEIQIFGWRS